MRPPPPAAAAAAAARASHASCRQASEPTSIARHQRMCAHERMYNCNCKLRMMRSLPLKKTYCAYFKTGFEAMIDRSSYCISTAVGSYVLQRRPRLAVGPGRS
jgi:hypothetical protein